MAWVFDVADMLFFAGQVFAILGIAYGAYLAWDYADRAAANAAPMDGRA